jgi:tetratricopeptide (TPR) repeat protein
MYENELHLHYAQLAHHAERAQLMEKAVQYLRQAGKAAADSYQNNQAVDFYTRALAFVAPEDLPSQYDLLAERVELYYRMGKRDLQWKDLTALERWAKDLGDMDRIAKTLMLQASYYFATGDYLNSIDCAKRAESYSTSAQVEHTELALYTQVVWCMALLRLGRLDEAMHRARATLYRDRSERNRKEECRILTAMGLIALEQKEPAQASKHLVDAVEIAREIKDPGLEARALNNLALSEASVNGNYALALQYYKQSYKIAIEIGDRTAESLAMGNLGFIAGIQGDFVAARSYHEQSLYLAREIGNRYQEAYTLINFIAVRTTGIGIVTKNFRAGRRSLGVVVYGSCLSIGKTARACASSLSKIHRYSQRTRSAFPFDGANSWTGGDLFASWRLRFSFRGG